jgi:hypothetical protein
MPYPTAPTLPPAPMIPTKNVTNQTILLKRHHGAEVWHSIPVIEPVLGGST